MLLATALALGLLHACRGPTEHPAEGAPVRAEPAGAGPVDLVLLGGRIVTLDPVLGEVEALAAHEGRVVFAGTAVAARARIGPQTRVLSLDGRLVVPGFIEGHGHFIALGDAKQRLDLTSVRSWDEVVDMVAGAASRATPGEWIVGRGWHQEKWDRAPSGAVEGFPTHDSVSAVSPDNPVMLVHASGHATFFNQRAMALAGVGRGTANPPGGEILRDATGAATGVFREHAAGLVARVHTASTLRRSPAARRAALRRSILLADRECMRHGVTSFQDAGSSVAEVELLRAMVEAGEIRTRLYVMVRDSNAKLAANLARLRTVDRPDQRFTVRAIKRSIDGALGSRGAWLLEDYSDQPGSRGLATATTESLRETAELAIRHGYQLCVHAIGDRANRETLNLFERVFTRHPGVDRRWRIEHAQHLHPDDIPRFAALGVIASMQGIHCTSDAPYVLARLGRERALKGAYVWRSLLRSGARVTNGTDAPVESVDPLASFYATVSRRLADGSVFFPDQCLTRMEALRSYTADGAFAAFEEGSKGTLAPGRVADMVVLSKDILRCAESQIPQARVDITVVGGVVRYQRE
ncbi:MAG: amidohydrolase [Planctomycetes bacterium]|nr:amidohydrolase [Planctomycetota bacterium]